MKSLVILTLPLLLVCTLSSCVTKPTQGGHPDVAILYGEPPEPMGWNNPVIRVWANKLDGKKINGREATLTKTGGLALTPGAHQVELTISSPSDNPGVYGGGLIGALVVEIAKSRENPREQTLEIKAKPGADYIARHSFEKKTNGHNYWVEDFATKGVVSGARPPEAVPVRSPFADPTTANKP